jgi:hypothetical protein
MTGKTVVGFCCVFGQALLRGDFVEISTFLCKEARLLTLKEKVVSQDEVCAVSFARLRVPFIPCEPRIYKSTGLNRHDNTLQYRL